MNEEKVFNVLTAVVVAVIGIGTLVLAGTFLMHALDIGIGAMKGAVYVGHNNPVAVMALDAFSAVIMGVVGTAAILALREI